MISLLIALALLEIYLVVNCICAWFRADDEKRRTWMKS